jgi:thiosulfate/3-mercaptopyruvate sulfurtransferase
MYRRRHFSVVTLLSVGLLLAACAPLKAPEQVSPLDDRRARFLVMPEMLMAELAGPADRRPVVLEVAMDNGRAFADGHVAGARMLPWSAVAERRDDVPNQIPPLATIEEALRALGIGEQTPIVLYDRIAGLASGRAWAVLDYAGLGDRTRVLDGQWPGWVAAGGATGTGEALTPPRGDVRLRPIAARVISGDRVADLVYATELRTPSSVPALRILDARPPAEFSGERPGDEVARPGHIPGASNLFWRDLVGPDEAPFLLGNDALREMFDAVGAPAGTSIVSYCRTGGQAGHLYFTARLLGYDVVLYDGSFVEWARNEDRPVVR